MTDLETVLTIFIVLITINLLVVGFYIVLILRDVRRTVNKAENVIDDVDKTVKDGLEKAQAMEAPLAALASTTQALSGAVKGTGAIKRMTETIVGPKDSTFEASNGNGSKKNGRRPRFFRRSK